MDLRMFYFQSSFLILKPSGGGARKFRALNYLLTISFHKNGGRTVFSPQMMNDFASTFYNRSNSPPPPPGCERSGGGAPRLRGDGRGPRERGSLGGHVDAMGTCAPCAAEMGNASPPFYSSKLRKKWDGWATAEL